MAVANFEELCAGFCEIAGLKAPRLEPDSRGLLAFHVTLRGVTIDVMHQPARSASRFFVIFHLGRLAEKGLREAARLKTLLKANFLPDQQSLGVYGCNPGTGDILLQQDCSLLDASPHGLLELIEAGTALASQWQQVERSRASVERNGADNG
jgi:hypothetical protein